MNVSFKDKCIALRKQDHTLTEIVEILGRNKTSVYFHIRDIPLSSQRKKEISERQAKRLSVYNASRKGKSERKFKKFSRWNNANVYVVAHFLFDGELTYSGCIYHNRSEVLTKKLMKYMEQIYEYPPFILKQDSGVVRISYYNVALASYLQRKAGILKKDIVNLPPTLQKEFLCAFFDDEGCVSFAPHRNSRQVRGFQHDENMLFLIANLLSNFGIQTKVDKKYNEIIVSRKENLEKFAEEINFSPGVKVNGKRTNSIWRKDLEKRGILQMALDSYQN